MRIRGWKKRVSFKNGQWDDFQSQDQGLCYINTGVTRDLGQGDEDSRTLGRRFTRQGGLGNGGKRQDEATEKCNYHKETKSIPGALLEGRGRNKEVNKWDVAKTVAPEAQGSGWGQVRKGEGQSRWKTGFRQVRSQATQTGTLGGGENGGDCLGASKATSNVCDLAWQQAHEMTLQQAIVRAAADGPTEAVREEGGEGWRCPSAGRWPREQMT